VDKSVTTSPYKEADIVRFMEYVADHGATDQYGVSSIDIGGAIVTAKIFDPFLKNPPMVKMTGAGWQMTFYLPGVIFIQGRAVVSGAPTHIEDLKIQEKDGALLRDITYAKLLM
jgi:hypothetical protein